MAALNEDLGQAFRSSAQLLYARNGNRMKALREGAGALLRVGRKTLEKGQAK